jgi:hypothetical protein
MKRKMLYQTFLVAVSLLIIACGLLPSGYESYDPRTPLIKDGELMLSSDYRSWNTFVPTVDRPDKEEVREIYVNDWGMKGAAANGFPNGTKFLMEIFSARRGSLVLMPNDKTLNGNTGGWRVEVYVDPQSLLLPGDIPAPCQQLSIGCGWSFTVVDRAVDTGIHVPKGASVRLVSAGTIRFSKGATPVNADGNGNSTPRKYPAPELRIHSLLCKVGVSGWMQCGTASAFTPTGRETLLRTPDGRLVKGKVQGLYLMQKGPNWGSATNYETGDWLFDHYRPTGQLCHEEFNGSGNGFCIKNPDIKWQYEKVPHQDWNKDCRRCHTPVMQDTNRHDRDFVYGYDQHFSVDKKSPVRTADTSRTSR